MSGAPLRRQLERAGLLLAGGALASRLIQALAYALLARSLAPADFGTLALAAVAVNALQLLPGLGLGTALLAQPVEPRAMARSAVTLALLGGGVVALLAGAIAWRMRAHGAGPVAPLVALLGVALLFQAPGAVAGALLDRELRFGARVAADVLSALAYLAASVTAAFLGFGAAALAIGLIAAAATQSGATLVQARLLPTTAPDLAALRTTAKLGALVVAMSLLQWLFTSIDLVVIERRFGREAVGCYSTALQLALVPATALGVLSGRIALPALVHARRGGTLTTTAAAASGFRQACSVAALLAAAACALFTVAPQPIVALLYGERFAGAASLLPIVAIGAFAKVLGALAGPALLACGRARTACGVLLAQVGLALPLATWMPAEFGVAGVALIFSAVQAGACIVAFVLGARALALPQAAALQAGLLPLIAGVAPSLLLHAWQPQGGGWYGLPIGMALLVALAARERRSWHTGGSE